MNTIERTETKEDSLSYFERLLVLGGRHARNLSELGDKIGQVGIAYFAADGGYLHLVLLQQLLGIAYAHFAEVLHEGLLGSFLEVAAE